MLDAFGVQGVIHPAASFLAGDETAVFEDFEVVGEEVERKVEVGLQLAHAAGASFLEVLEDLQAVFVAEDFEVLLEDFNVRCFNHG